MEFNYDFLNILKYNSRNNNYTNSISSFKK